MINETKFDYSTKLETKSRMETMYEWREWCQKIPFIKFKPEWEVKVIPPFGGAIARFVVKHPQVKQTISIYLDCYDELGYFGEPYWEMYPRTFDGCEDIYRVKMEDTGTLIKQIEDEFNLRMMAAV